MGIFGNFIADQPLRQPGHANDKLLELADALRRQDSWPTWFSWAFRHVFLRKKGQSAECGSQGCAIGLATIKWPELRLPSWADWYDNHERMTVGNAERKMLLEFFDIPNDLLDALFFEYETYGVTSFGLVTPTMVADAIDYYHKHGKLEGFDVQPN